MLAPHKSEPYAAWLIPFCLYRQFTFRVSASGTQLPRLGEVARDWEGWGRADTLAVGNSSTFSLKAYEALIENADSNRHYLGYMINIS